ncbi:MAG: hypothetical protein AAF865_07210 [Pseudomonadota bacterium]
MVEGDDISVFTDELLKRVHTWLDKIEGDIADLKVRMTATVTTIAQQGIQIATISSRLDQMDVRLTRIERRLDLTEA